MRLLWDIVLKDLRRGLAKPLDLAIALLIPLVLAGLMWLAFGKLAAGGDGAPKLRIVVVDLDRSPVARFLSGAGQNEEAAQRLEVLAAATREEALELARDREASAILVIPEGFQAAVLGGQRATLELIKNPSQRFLPVIAERGAEVVALYLSAASRLLADDSALVRRLLEGQGWEDDAALVTLIARLRERITSASGLLFPPASEVVEATTTEAGEAPRGFDWMAAIFPGVLVMGLLFTAVGQMKDLLREREAGTLRRLLAAPLRPGRLLVAKILSVAVVVGLAHAILTVCGSLAFGVRWGAPGTFLVVSLLVVLAATGFAALLFAIVRTERQGDALSGIVIMVMSLLGGSFVPIEVLPDFMQTIARFTVNHWAHDALRKLATGGHWADVAGHAAALAAIAVATATLGALGLRRRLFRGAV